MNPPSCLTRSRLVSAEASSCRAFALSSGTERRRDLPSLRELLTVNHNLTSPQESVFGAHCKCIAESQRLDKALSGSTQTPTRHDQMRPPD